MAGAAGSLLVDCSAPPQKDTVDLCVSHTDPDLYILYPPPGKAATRIITANFVPEGLLPPGPAVDGLLFPILMALQLALPLVTAAWFLGTFLGAFLLCSCFHIEMHHHCPRQSCCERCRLRSKSGSCLKLNEMVNNSLASHVNCLTSIMCCSEEVALPCLQVGLFVKRVICSKDFHLYSRLRCLPLLRSQSLWLHLCRCDC